MAENIIKEIIPFTQDEIETEVKQLLLAKGVTDILYPGSNISQMADIMTYLIHVLNTNTAINLQEVILPLASKRMNVLFGARQLGYEAVQKTSYRYTITLQIRENLDENGDPTTGDFRVQIPKYTTFSSNGNTYYYLGEDIDIVTNNQERFDQDFDITIKEGNLISYEDNELLRFRAFNIIDSDDNIVTKQNYLVPFRDVEEDGLEVYLTYVDTYGTTVVKESWEKSEQFLIDSSFAYQKRKFIRLENFFLQFPSIFFEIGGYGNPIRLNTLVEMNALISKGASGKAGDSFTVSDTTLSEQISTSPGVISHYGTDEEHIDSIKENAPIFHNTANRAVTALDYVALSQRHEAVKQASVWGGEDEVSNRFANILFSFTPERTVREFSSTDPLQDSNTVDENYALNLQYDLQSLPRRPEIPNADNPDLYGIVPKPTNPDWIPQPSSYLEKPDSWNTALTAEPVAVTNPGAGPAFTWEANRDAYGSLIFPNDWVENPDIDAVWLANNVGMNWATTEQMAVIKSSKQIEAYEAYKDLSFKNDEFGQPLSSWTQALEDEDQDWFDNTSGISYKAYIIQQATIDYIQWRRDTTLYYNYTLNKEEWDRLTEENSKYSAYITSKEGIEYTNYWNSFASYTSTPAELQARQDEEVAYNEYLVNLELYQENQEAIDGIVDNWYLNDTNDVYPLSPPPLAPLRDTNVFTVLDAYKIMTMKHNHRKPAYVDFNFIVKIIKYNLASTTADINATIFGVINDYFADYIEDFEVEYFASNLKRRVDEALGDNSGVEISLTNSIAIHPTMYDTKYSGSSKIITRLAFPFENLYPDGLNMTNQQFLPSIDTLSFLGAVTDYRLTDSSAFSIGAGDSVLEKRETDGTGDNTDGIFGVKYISKISQSLDSATADFTDAQKWDDLGGNYDHYYSAGDVSVNFGENVMMDGTTTPLADNGYYYTLLILTKVVTMATEDFTNEAIWSATKATKYSITKDGSSAINIKTGDTVYADSLTNTSIISSTLGSVFKAKKELDNVDIDDVLSVDFTLTNDWEEFIPVSKDLYCLRQDDDFGNLTYRVDLNEDPANPGSFLSPTNEMSNIILDVYLGDIKNNEEDPAGNLDAIVGKYYIRNDRFQHIDVHIDFDTTGEGNGAPADSVFTDNGYGHIDLIYPSNVDINSDNIPFTGYTIPRLRQVKFQKDS